MAVVFVAALLLFGAKRLPEVARTIGRTLEGMRRASDDFRRQLTAETDLSDVTDVTPEPTPAPNARPRSGGDAPPESPADPETEADAEPDDR
jgi:TatA/E family protein of Tat protein translocase